MKFIIDAQLPKSLAQWLVSQGYDAIHTLDLPKKNATDDDEINQISLRDKRILISKDSDFFDSYFRKLNPYKLIYLTTGNISTPDLLKLFELNLQRILDAIDTNFVVEIQRSSIIVID
ncbi:MAG: DUF5615 family PIN-like protein [Lewinellaceae bacterium]|nr:DUF5615 family PIN-like protein [Saprospiraceae bacterium]MCB9338062.1 DUF5615 family PIN-like protein [Lewinellaceae bacterium]